MTRFFIPQKRPILQGDKHKGNTQVKYPKKTKTPDITQTHHNNRPTQTTMDKYCTSPPIPTDTPT